MSRREGEQLSEQWTRTWNEDKSSHKRSGVLVLISFEILGVTLYLNNPFNLE
jgi:hypothetical protein